MKNIPNCNNISEHLNANEFAQTKTTPPGCLKTQTISTIGLWAMLNLNQIGYFSGIQMVINLIVGYFSPIVESSLLLRQPVGFNFTFTFYETCFDGKCP